MDDEQFDDMGEGDEELEGFTVVHAHDLVDLGDRPLANDADWPETAWPLSIYDVAATTAGLAANIAMVFSIYFRDLRRDLASARNFAARKRSVADFDREVLSLPVTLEDPE